MVASFGQMIRAARLGFHQHTALGCFVRVEGDGPFLVTLATGDGIMRLGGGQARREGFHRAWWEDKDAQVMLSKAPGLKPFLGGKLPQSVVQVTLDDNGRALLGAR